MRNSHAPTAPKASGAKTKMASTSAKIPRSKNLSGVSQFIFGSQKMNCACRRVKRICFSASRRKFLFHGFGAKFQNFPRLAFERFANRFERGETDGLGLAGL